MLLFTVLHFVSLVQQKKENSCPIPEAKDPHVPGSFEEAHNPSCSLE